MGRKIISQSEAARMWKPRPCKRQRIHQLIKDKRFTIPTDDNGNEVKGCVYLDEVVNFKERLRGRPRLTKKELTSRGLTGFEIGDKVVWDHKPKDGYGFFVHIPGTVIKMATKRLKLKLETPRGTVEVWAARESCRPALSDKLARPKKIGQGKRIGQQSGIPESGILVTATGELI